MKKVMMILALSLMAVSCKKEDTVVYEERCDYIVPMTENAETMIHKVFMNGGYDTSDYRYFKIIIAFDSGEPWINIPGRFCGIQLDENTLKLTSREQ